MNRKYLNKGLALAMAFFMGISLFPMQDIRAAEQTGATKETEYERIDIYTAEEFAAFANKCYIDAWSKNKYISLKANIDLTGVEFELIPVFKGIFDGAGHTISGFNYTGNGYAVGLFRYIEGSGVVQNLTLKGNIDSENEKECIGSICGINYGTIKNCTFQGNVSGRDTIGGITGINKSTGIISECTVRGWITGYYSTGGVCGINHGVLNNCINHAGINNNNAWVEKDDEMGGIDIIGNITSDDDSGLYSGVDTGGITGYSDGVITACTNFGTVGYEHTGYNIGGIAGRQSGVVSVSVNNGIVYGRKDIGGIVGQMEPFIEINEAESLRDALNKLHILLNKTLDDLSAGKNAVKADLDNMAAYGDAILESGDALAEQMTNFINDNIDQAQEITRRMEYIMDMLPDVFDNVSNAGDALSNMNDALKRVSNDLDIAGMLNGSIYNEADKEVLDAAKKDISTNIDNLQDSSEKLNQLIKDMKDRDDITEEKVEQLSEYLGDLLSASTSLLSNFSTISKIMKPYISDAADSFQKDLDDAINYTQAAITSLKAAENSMRGIVNYINAQNDIQFTKLGDNFDAAREDLHNQLQGISDSLKNLNANASNYSDIVNEDLKAVNNQINVVFNLLADRMIDAEQLSVEELYEEIDDENIDSITTGRTDACTNKGIVKGDINVGGIAGSMDIDDEDLEGNAAGSVEYKIGRRFITKCLITNSINEGYVTSKKDGAGGICGYMNHGIIVNSEGYGSVTSSEGNFVGGICGESLTIIKNCYSMCSVSGNKNAGGIAGYANTLQNCYSMAAVKTVNGREGAIAGQVSSYEAVDTESSESEQKISGNYYVSDESDTVYGIDNVSYTGMAEPISYADLLTVENLPVQFRHLEVIYKIGDAYLGSEEVPYGTALDHLNYPQIPKKEGFYGVWPDISDQKMKGTIVVEAEYRDNVTIVQSSTGADVNEAAQGARITPYALAEGIFTEDTVLNAAVSDTTPPKKVGKKQYTVYDVSLENGGIGQTDSFTLRMLNPYEDTDVSVYGYQDGRWTQLENKSRGRYLQVVMTGTQEYFCIVEKKTSPMFFIIAAAVIVLILLIIIMKKISSHTKKRRQLKAA